MAQPDRAPELAREKEKPIVPEPPAKTTGPRLTPEGAFDPLPPVVGFAVAEALDRFTAAGLKSMEAKEAEVRRLTDRILKEVPTLYLSIAEKIAYAVVYSRLPPFKLATAFRTLAEFKARGVNKDGSPQTADNRRRYFVETMKFCFKDANLDWFDNKPPAAPTDDGAS